MIPGTRFVISSITLSVIASLAILGAAKSEPFHVANATDYAHQTSDRVTIGAKPYNTEELTAEAFGKKTDLLKYGVLPVLVVVQNNRQKTLDLREIEVNLVAADGRHASSVNPEDIPYLWSQHRRSAPSQVPHSGSVAEKEKLTQLSRNRNARILGQDAAPGQFGERLFLLRGEIGAGRQAVFERNA